MRDRIHSREQKEALELGSADDEEEEVNVAPIAPTPSSETSIIVCLMVGLVILCMGLLKRFGDRPVRARPRLAIQHAFVHSRARLNDSDHAELSRLRWQLGALGIDERTRVTVFFADGAPVNASDPLVRAASRLSQRAAREVATLRRLVRGVASYAARAPSDPIVLIASQRAVLTPGALAIVDEAIRHLETGAAGGWDALFARPASLDILYRRARTRAPFLLGTRATAASAGGGRRRRRCRRRRATASAAASRATRTPPPTSASGARATPGARRRRTRR
jgi:hypothetical protein